MRAALLIARHDLRRQLRNRTAIVTGFIAPLAMAAIVGLAFGHSSTGFVRVVVADQDHTAASGAALQSIVDNAGFGTLIVLDKVPDEATARSQFDRGTAGAAVVIRPGYGDVLAGRQGARAQVDAITSRHRPYAEQVAQSVVRGLYGEISANVLTVRTAVGNGTVTPEQFATLTAAMRAQPAPVKITEDGVPARKGLLGYFGPSMAIVFLFLGVGAGARSFLGERDTGTLARLKAAPIGLGKVVGGKVTAVLALAFLSIMVVWGVTAAAFHAYWGPPLGVLALSVATVLAFGSIALFLTVSSRTPAQSDATMAIVAFVLALLGGNFFPPGSLPPALERLSLATPNGWALQGFGNMALDRQGFAGIHQALIVLLVIAAVIGAVALTRLRTVVAAA